jgi:hypothetical protein
MARFGPELQSNNEAHYETCCSVRKVSTLNHCQEARPAHSRPPPIPPGGMPAGGIPGDEGRRRITENREARKRDMERGTRWRYGQTDLNGI